MTDTPPHLLRTAGASVPADLHKSLPPGGPTAALGGRLSLFPTPVAVLSAPALDANITAMADWCAARGLQLAPHGKTTMAPAIWARQLAAGAWGITVATPFQARVALAAGVGRVLLANELVDPVGLAALADDLIARPDARLLCFADSTAAVTIMNGVLAGHPDAEHLAGRIEVLAEWGAARTGARDRATARAVADAVAGSPWLTLRGVAAYEGAVSPGTGPTDAAAVRTYLRDAVALHDEVGPLVGAGQAVLTAGGSVWFDEVADVFGPVAGPDTPVILRSGAYITHDDGRYRADTPAVRAPGSGGPTLRAALHVWARVVSRPEPGLALLDAGRRDLPIDAGLPEVQRVADRLGAPSRPLTATITALADQHAFLVVDPTAGPDVGQVVRLGISHPCTTFDRWRVLPLVDAAPDDHAHPDPTVVETVHTWF